MDVQLFGADGRNEREKRRVVSGKVLPIAKEWTQNDLPAAGGRNPRHVHLCTISGCSYSRPGVHFVYDPGFTTLQLKNNFPSHPTKATNHKNRFKKSSAIKRPVQTPNYSSKPKTFQPPVQSHKCQLNLSEEKNRRIRKAGYWLVDLPQRVGVTLRP